MQNSLVVVLGMSPTGLYAVRELGKAGFQVYAVDSRRLAAGYSRYLADSRAYMEVEDDHRLLEELDQLARKNEPEKVVLIPTSDNYIEFIVNNASELSQRFLFQQAYKNNLYNEIVDKGQFAEKCREHGVAHPRTLVLHSSKLYTATENLRFPCLLKPTLIHLVKDRMAGQKVLIVRNEQEFKKYLTWVEELDTDWMVQEIIPGPESRITLFGGYFARDGGLRQAFSCRKLRQYPAGFGSASLVRSELLEETIETSRNFLMGLGFHGVAGTEFKYDERDRQLKIIEINPRPTLWFGCAHAAGKRIVYEAVSDMLEMPHLSEIPQKEGVSWRYLGKDLVTQGFYRRHGNEFVLPTEDLTQYPGQTDRVWAVYSRDDPWPLYGELRNYVQKFSSRYFRRG